MHKNIFDSLDGVAKTLLGPLYMRALESQRPDAMLRDSTAVALMSRLHFDPSVFKFDEDDQAILSLRNREIDRSVRRVLDRLGPAIVVHIGCGLDSRFARVAPRGVVWYDMDLPEVIALRRSLLGADEGPYHLLSCSVMEDAWMDMVGNRSGRPFVFVAEGVLQYFDESQVRSLVLNLQQRFPGAELICDVVTRSVADQMNAKHEDASLPPVRWAAASSRELETWNAGIVLLHEWFYLDQPEPRLHALLHLAESNPLIAKAAGIVHYRLGSA